jgi:hypothetical protein
MKRRERERERHTHTYTWCIYDDWLGQDTFASKQLPEEYFVAFKQD